MNTVIKDFVDKGLEWLEKKDLLMRPDPNMPVEMIDTTREQEDDWKPWEAIDSTVTDEGILELENKIGYRYPQSYKEFLKYKHFYEIHTIDSFRPFEHLIHFWKETLLENYMHVELKEFMLDKGYIWFGDYEDWGFLCFDTNKKSADYDYPVVLIDHESVEQQQTIYKNFIDCLQKNAIL